MRTCAVLLFAAVSAACQQTTVARFDVFELTLASTEDFANPFLDAPVKAEFHAPDGRTLRAAGFYRGDSAWMVRFVPDQEGPWTYAATLTGKERTVRSAGGFRCVPSRSHGFLRVSKRNPYRLEFDDGTPFHPLGVQNCGYVNTDIDGPNPDGSWRSVPAADWAQAWDGAANLIRWQLGAGTKAGCALSLIPEKGNPARYDTALAATMDQLLALQRSHGFAVILIPFQDMSLGGKDAVTAFGKVGDLAGYKSIDAPNLPQQEAYLRYIVARFGAFVDIWELFNEDSWAPDSYLARLAAVVREADPYRHPITTNYTRSAAPWCEIVTWHGYVRIPAEQVDRWIAAQVGRYKSYSKPVLNTEFGNKGTLSNYDPLKWRIAAWSAWMSESNVLFWNMSGRRTEPRDTQGNSNAYLGPDSRAHFRVFRDFTRDLPIDLRPVECSYTYHNEINLYAVSNGRTSVLYAHHFADHSKAWEGPDKIYVNTGPGRFRITWIDPADGRVVAKDQCETAQQDSTFAMPPVTVDLACRIDRLE